MEEDIQNYLPAVMFRGTPCMINYEFIFLQNPTWQTRPITGITNRKLFQSKTPD